LAGGVAHEINNPIGIILGFAQSVARGIKDDNPLAMPLKSIEREAIRCKELVHNLLAFSRSSAPEHREETDFNVCVGDAISLVLAQTKVKEVSVIQELDPDPPRLTANRNQVQQIIINLCNNAIDAMPKGGRLTVRTGHVAHNGGIASKLEIADTGTGIPKDLQSRIFEPFFTTKEIGKGTGLGLALVHEIVTKHGGNIELSSEEGKGTTFFIFFPAFEKKLPVS
jgi:signal transduction histidine kinase